MIKINDLSSVDLDDLAEIHYNNLILSPLVCGTRYHSRDSLIGRISTQKDKDNTDGNHIMVSFWNFLLDNNFTNLKRVIKGHPDVLENLIGEIHALCGVNFFCTDTNYNDTALTANGIIVKKVFNYSNYRGKKECRTNCEKLNLQYCPYCNEQPIQVITQIDDATAEEDTLALLQLDHFYPQSRHPYFGLSFFNLIPGCSPCNAQLKREKRFARNTHFNPFEKRFDDYFLFQIDNLAPSCPEDISISYINKQPHPTNALIDFELLERYTHYSHKRVIYKLVKSFKNHSPKINNSISFQIKNLFNFGESQKIVLLESSNVPLSIADINHVQLGKLKRDVAIQMEVL
ncbi:hypothetical protein [Flavobacterium sp.]|uniref:hypothetical protein n=1 Tax=Flavobacterium sp. TaxID=239 RepID=UPI0025BAD2D1|nr:hypothetical protein [Flavobacterium sp.]